MKLIIHDLDSKDFIAMFPDLANEMIISQDAPIHHCTGCFGCWIKTPAVCVIRDKYGDMGELLSKCDELLILSRCRYGGFSPFVKNVMDRSISYIHPYFTMRNGEMHHRRRYANHMKIKVWFYGEEITENERKTAEKLVKANAVNLDSDIGSITFLHSIAEIGGQVL